jgi:drug/metabolite transporter (DMT)-like permease
MTAPDALAGERSPDSLSVARATTLVLFAACCFGSISVLALIAMRGGTPLPSVLAWRYGLAAVVLASFSSFTVGARALRLPRARALRMLLLGGGGQAAVSFLSLSSLRYVSAATLAFLFYTYPAWVALFAALRGTEPVDLKRGIALALSLAGIAIMVGAPGTNVSTVGALLALSAAVVYALYIPLIGRLGSGLAPAVTSAYIAVGATVIFAVSDFIQGTATLPTSAGSWGAIATMAMLSTAIAFILFLRGLAVLGPVRTAIVSTVEPFWTAVLGALVLSQPLTRSTVFGGAMIAAAVLLLQLRGRRSAAQS